jgi:hypothetical protein
LESPQTNLAHDVSVKLCQLKQHKLWVENKEFMFNMSLITDKLVISIFCHCEYH